MKEIQTQIDHLMLGIIDLEEGIKQFEALTGVKPILGGEHPGVGTHNALVALGKGQYLEIIAPIDKSVKPFGSFGNFEQTEKLMPVGWAIATNNMEKLVKTENQSIAFSRIIPMSRTTPLGNTLRWTNAFILVEETMSINPFLIEWESEKGHPSETTPKGCTIDKVTINANYKDDVGQFLKSLSLDTTFSTNHLQPTGKLLGFALNTPKGRVVFGDIQD